MFIANEEDVALTQETNRLAAAISEHLGKQNANIKVGVIASIMVAVSKLKGVLPKEDFLALCETIWDGVQQVNKN